MLCDVRMPGDAGIDLLRELTADFPDLAVIIANRMRTILASPKLRSTSARLATWSSPSRTNELLISLASALHRRDLQTAQRDQLQALEQTIVRTWILAGVLEGFGGQPGASPGGDEEMIERLSCAVSLRDEETGHHIERMSRYAVVIAKAVGYTAAPLEDLRSRRLSTTSARSESPTASCSNRGRCRARVRGNAAPCGDRSTSCSPVRPRSCCESRPDRVDAPRMVGGGGYPRGLQGEEIPEEARIAAVADVFDALTSNRVYRPACRSTKPSP